MTAAGLIGTDRPLAEAYDLALVDLDGVAYRGPLPIDHAAEGLTSARERGLGLVFVTNNASREPGSVSDQLTSLGIPTQLGPVQQYDRWHCVELGLVLDPGTGGAVRLWYDDELVIESTGLATESPGDRFTAAHVGLATSDDSSGTTQVDYDDVVIASERIGCAR